MTITARRATDTELATYIRAYDRIRFRHFVRETYSPRAKNGIAHRQYTTAKIDTITVISGRYRNAKLAGTHCTLPCGTTFVTDIRIDSPHLPTNV